MDFPVLGSFLNYLVSSYDINLSILIALIFIIAAIVVAVLRIYLLKFNALFIVMVGSNLSVRVFKNYLIKRIFEYKKKFK